MFEIVKLPCGTWMWASDDVFCVLGEKSLHACLVDGEKRKRDNIRFELAQSRMTDSDGSFW